MKNLSTFALMAILTFGYGITHAATTSATPLMTAPIATASTTTVSPAITKDITAMETVLANDIYHAQFSPLLNQAKTFIYNKQYDQAMKLLDTITNAYEKKYTDKSRDIFSVRTPDEAKLSIANRANKATQPLILTEVWSNAVYLKGYIAVDKGDMIAGAKILNEALKLAPMNSLILSERAHIFQSQKDWKAAYMVFNQANIVSKVSPKSETIREKTRALRGMAFSLTELKQFEAAKALYQQCLQLDPNDKTSVSELQYIAKLTGKK